MSDVIVRKPKEELTDAQKYSVLLKYSEGVPLSEIAEAVSRDKRDVSKFIQSTLKNMNVVRETNTLNQRETTKQVLMLDGKHPSHLLTPQFLSLVETNGSMYAYYFAATGDNRFAIDQSGFNIGIHQSMRKATKDYVYRIRGQFLRDVPYIRSLIQEEQEKRIKEYRLEKPEIQMELVNQIQELKEVVQDDPKQRANLLKAIELLGRTIAAFTDRVEVDETDARSGLEILMEKAKGEIYEQKKE